MAKILVTGASGFIGFHLIPRCSREAMKLIAWCGRSRPWTGLRASNIAALKATFAMPSRSPARSPARMPSIILPGWSKRLASSTLSGQL